MHLRDSLLHRELTVGVDDACNKKPAGHNIGGLPVLTARLKTLPETSYLHF